MFEIQKSGDKTSTGEIGLDIRTHVSPKVGQDQVSGGVSVPYHFFQDICMDKLPTDFTSTKDTYYAALNYAFLNAC